MADWSMLPCELLGAIALKLDTLEDFIYFSTVCRSWNYASSFVKRERNATNMMPWLLLPENTKDNTTHHGKIYNLTNNKCYQLSMSMPEIFGARCWGSSYGWIVMLTMDFQVQLFNPLTKQRLSLPSILDLPNFPFNPDDIDDPDRYWSWHVISFVVLKMASTNDLIVAVIYDLFNYSLALARLGEQSWTLVGSRNFQTVGCRDNFIYMVFPYGELKYCEFGRIFDGKAVEVFEYVPHFRTRWITSDKFYLLNSGDDFLLVLREKGDYSEYEDENEDEDDNEVEDEDDDVEVEDENEMEDGEQGLDYYTFKFSVFRLDHKNKKWVEVDDFGNFSIFVGFNTAISVPVSLANKLRRNCIYFTDDEKTIWAGVPGVGGRDMGIYDMKTGGVTKFYKEYNDDVDVGSLLFCPPIFFVPNC